MEIEENVDDFNDSCSDSDLADIEELNSLFLPCHNVSSQSVGPKYILHISATNDTNCNIVTALSDASCDVFNLTESQLHKLNKFQEHNQKLIDCKFSSDNRNLFFTGSSDGTIKIWDLRVPTESVITFKDTTLTEGSSVKPLSSFDVSPSNILLAAGTELTDGDAYILFWDIRNTALLGAYWESHTDDITQVKFHPNDSNKLISGSTDKLINIYNLLESNEDDALQECLNTEALVEELQWFNVGKQWKISCVTSTNDLQLWETDGAEPYKCLSRVDIASQIKKNPGNTYIAAIHPLRNSLFALCGSNNSLRSLNISTHDLNSGFQCLENTQRVRSSWINEHTNLLLTGGEKGKLDVWKPDFSQLNLKDLKRKNGSQ
ncbi:WD repeat-containing protein 89 [Dendroctonus ponderosae]|uniref:WD repeat-containing protein 89 n=1 Tax=Dendroctonus ponderosae TaxID=77166 RepID=U4UU55_DENPD|nr:WD repeat-containing protein 89 [Dendroctonus ponderosae]ERL93726.1 hypothetical protein D910_11012 [Dendroctonus ponderosae]KAH1015448.1 hypothetical protein HUJ05_013171 [Dendroctonus ponderosae]KAH1015450.1 hypothetical protein HUJ05_013171 [Dendroctonus ponderosae]